MDLNVSNTTKPITDLCLYYCNLSLSITGSTDHADRQPGEPSCSCVSMAFSPYCLLFLY